MRAQYKTEQFLPRKTSPCPPPRALILVIALESDKDDDRLYNMWVQVSGMIGANSKSFPWKN